ncbi:VpaChn25_0724 family phage protein [Parachitinimonas caeni]|uniref:ArsR family transcriptional regulator n=1 Tax=Parachitinimonas caeni TaxID=3031301 RepID=A0ABT7DZH2_9NEIS|nr:ArsR family transcriptional regulator [Parachitinimonas caeni]MDK2124478.1 ArsR family transcriptional regulator [Parachitinimonas caeni]
MDLQEANRRRAILVALSISAQYRLPIRPLRDILESVGHVLSLDRLRTDLSWLTEQGCIELGANDLAIAKDRGVDVAMGRTHIPGIARPTPTEVGSLSSALATTGINLAKALGGY